MHHENIKGIDHLHALLQARPRFTREQVTDIIDQVRDGLSSTDISETTGVNERAVRKLVAATGRALGQSIKNTSGLRDAADTPHTRSWTHGRGAIKQAYLWVTQTPRPVVLAVAETHAHAHEITPTYEHHYDCWLAANYTWLSLEDIVTKPDAASAYLTAATTCITAIQQLRTSVAQLLTTRNPDESYTHQVRSINWHLRLPEHILLTRPSTISANLRHAHRQHSLLLPAGMCDIDAEDLGTLIATCNPGIQRQQENAPAG